MPENLFSNLIIKGHQLQDAISLQRSSKIPKLVLAYLFLSFFGLGTDRTLSKGRLQSFGVFYPCYNSSFGKVLRDRFGESIWCGNKSLSLQFFPVFELNRVIFTVMVISGLSAASRILFSLSLICAKRLVLNVIYRYLLSMKAGFLAPTKFPPSLTFSSIFCAEDSIVLLPSINAPCKVINYKI